MTDQPKFAVIGGGSWATAIAKMLCVNLPEIAWYMRNEEAIEHIKTHFHNPNYLSSVEFHVEKLRLTNDINEAVAYADYIIFAIPSAFLSGELSYLQKSNIQNSIFPSFAMMFPKIPKSEEEKEMLKSSIEGLKGSGNAGKTAAFFANDKDITKNLSLVQFCDLLIGSESVFKTMSSMSKIKTLVIHEDNNNRFRDRVFTNPYIQTGVMNVYKYKNLDREITLVLDYVKHLIQNELKLIP